MRKNNILNTHKNKAILVASLVALVLVGAGAFYYYRQHKQPAPASVIEGTIPGEKINLNPPTEEEKQQADDNKRRIVEQQEQENQPQTGNKKVTPFISDATQYGQQIEVRAYVAGIFESGGTCKAVFTRNGQTVTKEAAVEKNVSDTTCHTIIINRSEFPSSGDWSLVLTYSSSTANGSSEAKTVKVN